jgi:ubiquinone/menaquinone biosynthesis C-methylase UbiE
MKNSQSNIEYYNAIATEYNNMLKKDLDIIIRQKVANQFCNIVRNGAVLDFGGGTGLDLSWLSDNNHTVYFCEPSAGMREIAISDHSDLPKNNIIFLDDLQADFRQWHLQLPFAEQVDAVLSNFAVLNCIQDIELLFQNLALVIKQRGHLMALVLTQKFAKMQRGNFYSILASLIHKKPVSVRISYKKHQQTVHIHSVKEIIKASETKFNFCGSQPVDSSVFTLINLQRK